jgi:hypothetical protein
MAGPVPAIHVLPWSKEDVDARHKAGHDGSKSRSKSPRFLPNELPRIALFSGPEKALSGP